jgi:hypothetical protein
MEVHMISLNIDGHSLFFDDDFDVTNKNIKVLKVRNVFYARIGNTYLHRKILNAQRGEIVDHVNGNGLDNRKENLRIACHQSNRLNRLNGKTKKTSEYFGVSVERDGKKIRVQMKINGKKKNFYGFKTEKEAGLFYDKKAKELYGEKALLNFN